MSHEICSHCGNLVKKVETPPCPACKSVATLPNTKSRVPGSTICGDCGCTWLPEVIEGVGVNLT